MSQSCSCYIASTHYTLSNLFKCFESLKDLRSDHEIKQGQIQSTLVISTSVISNHRLSRRENLFLVLTLKSKIRSENIVEKSSNFSPFPQYFQYIFLTKGVTLHSHCEIWLFVWYFPQFCTSDMSKYGYLEVFQQVPSTSR